MQLEKRKWYVCDKLLSSRMSKLSVGITPILIIPDQKVIVRFSYLLTLFQIVKTNWGQFLVYRLCCDISWTFWELSSIYLTHSVYSTKKTSTLLVCASSDEVDHKLHFFNLRLWSWHHKFYSLSISTFQFNSSYGYYELQLYLPNTSR